MKRVIKQSAGRRGVTFTEITLAIMILALAIVPMVSMLVTETKQTAKSRDRMVAAHLASSILERFRMEDVETLSIALDSMEAGRDFIASDPLLTASLPKSYDNFLARFERYVLFELDADSGGRKGVLKAIIRWNERGHDRELVMGTVLVNAHFPGGRP